MSSLKFAVLCVLTAYLLVVAFNFITKLRDARLMQKLLCMLFPISQICLIAFPLACSARYGLSAAVYVSLIVLGIACGPVDLLLFHALDQACRWFDSSSKVNMLQEQLRVQNALRQRSRHERDQASALRDQLRERLEQARADLRADQAGKAGESLEDVISLIGARPSDSASIRPSTRLWSRRPVRQAIRACASVPRSTSPRTSSCLAWSCAPCSPTCSTMR